MLAHLLRRKHSTKCLFSLLFLAQCSHNSCPVNGDSLANNVFVRKQNRAPVLLGFISHPSCLRRRRRDCNRQAFDAVDQDDRNDDSSAGDCGHDFWLNLGSAITTESCRLLGIKSLGVDYGLVRTGVAVTVGYEPKPLAIISDMSQNISELCRTIVQYASTQQVQQIVVGLPLHKNGTIADQTLLTLNFTQQLAVAVLSHLGPEIPLFLFDERYTSKEAAAREHSKNPSSALYGTLDSAAACIILENYYEDNGVGAYAVNVPDPLRMLCIEQYSLRLQEQEQKRLSRIKVYENKVKSRLDAIAQAKLLDEKEKRESGFSLSNRPRKRKKKK
jgi:putative holliday junction resolvase